MIKAQWSQHINNSYLSTAPVTDFVAVILTGQDLVLQLAEALQASDPKVPIETIEVEKEGICIRYCPLENSYGM